MAAPFQLLTPLKLAKDLVLKNRVVLAPMTRARSSRDGVPTELVQTYYEQRADAGLLVTEGSGVSKQGYVFRGFTRVSIYSSIHCIFGRRFRSVGWFSAPGLFNSEQAGTLKSNTSMCSAFTV